MVKVLVIGLIILFCFFIYNNPIIIGFDKAGTT